MTKGVLEEALQHKIISNIIAVAPTVHSPKIDKKFKKTLDYFELISYIDKNDVCKTCKITVIY